MQRKKIFASLSKIGPLAASPKSRTNSKSSPEIAIAEAHLSDLYRNLKRNSEALAKLGKIKPYRKGHNLQKASTYVKYEGQIWRIGKDVELPYILPEKFDASKWEAVFGGEFSVSPYDFGAVGDSVTDDSDALQKCFDFVTSSTKFRFEAGSNVFAISKTLLFGHDENGRAGFHDEIVGLRLRPTGEFPFGKPMLEINKNHMVLANCVFFCERRADGIRMRKSRIALRIVHNRIDKPATKGINIVKGGHDYLIAHNHIQNDPGGPKKAIGIWGLTGDAMIYGNTIALMKLSIYVAHGGTQIIGNHCYQGSGGGMETSPREPAIIIDGDDTIVVGNYIDKSHILVANGYVKRLAENERFGILISNNIFYTKAEYTEPDQFIRFDNDRPDIVYRDILITGNVFTNTNGKTAPNLRMCVAGSSDGLGSFTAENIIIKDNVGSSIQQSATAFHKTLMVPTGKKSIVVSFDNVNNPFGLYDLLQVAIPNNPQALTITTAIHDVGQNAYKLSLSDAPEAPLMLYMSVRSTCEISPLQGAESVDPTQV